MKQLVLDLKTGATSLLEVPSPSVQDGHLLIQTSCSLVSAGTERMLVDFGKAGWLEKARQQPERVQQVIHKIRTDGLKPTLDAVFNKLDQPLPLGYSQSGTIIGVGRNVVAYKVGDRVVSNGNHAEVVSIPENLVAKIPENVSDEAAAFTVVGAIALQSIRLVNPTFGETIVVIGLGLIGQLTIQLLRANGCRVIGVDIDDTQVANAVSSGITAINSKHTDAVKYIGELTKHGADGVIITATSTGDDIISLAANICRKRGRIVLTGVTGLDLKRSEFYEKELSFQVSCSYGPGRYEMQYEQKGLDYPIGYVRWTEQRNFEAVLQAMSAGQLPVEQMIGQRLRLEDYDQAYNSAKPATGATLLQYDLSRKHTSLTNITTHITAPASGGIAVVGAGNFTTGILLPALKKIGAPIKTIVSKGGLSAASAAKKFGIAQATTDFQQVLTDPAIDTIFITTRHQHHASMVIEALQAGKHVFVEKPLAISISELNDVSQAYRNSGRQLFVGFNRRYAPLAVKMKALLKDAAGPMNIVMTINAGTIPQNHWLNDTDSGGRLIGEACHFIDLCSYITGSLVRAVSANSAQKEDVSILLHFVNGSSAVINYFTNGSKAYDKERIEVFSDGRVLILENWKKLRGYGFRHFSSTGDTQDKGHQAQFREVLTTITSGNNPAVSFNELMNTSKATLAVVQSIADNKWINPE